MTHPFETIAMTEQSNKPTLSLKKQVSDKPESGQAPATTLPRKRSVKRVIRREELAQTALGRTKVAPTKPIRKKPKKTVTSAARKRQTSPSDLRLMALDQQLCDTSNIWRDNQPLALGIEKSLFRFIAEHHISASKRVVQKLLQRHTTTRSYRDNILQSAQRYDLDGSPVGQISQIEKDHAQRQIDVVHSA